MKHITITVATIGQLTEFFAGDIVQNAAKSAQSVLVQVFVGHRDALWIMSVVKAIQIYLPEAVIVGISSAGEICAGHVSLKSTVVSVSLFRATSLYPVVVDSFQGGEYATGEAIAEALKSIPDLQGILLLAPPTRLNCAKILAGIEEHLPATLVFGGGAAETLDGKQVGLFFQSNFLADGCVAVGLASAALHIETHIFLGWQALGPEMILTDVDGLDVRRIDNNPALDVYHKYLGILPYDESMYLIEFPLLLERYGTQVARNAVSSGKDRSVRFIADIYQGETVRLGYLDVDLVLKNTESIVAKLEKFSPEAVYLYSCICRRFTLQRCIESETYPFQALAPVAGFFTTGEFCQNGSRLQLLNSSQIVVAMREGNTNPLCALQQHIEPNTAINSISLRHTRITSRLLHFIATLSDELEEANRKLVFLAQHDALTGALNRHEMDATINTEISRSARYDRVFSLVMIDLDYFKRFNDNYGHSGGDIVLKGVADTVRNSIRSSDLLFRFGGEEFLLLLSETAMDGALDIAEKIRAAIACLSLYCGKERLPRITASFGVACYPKHGKDGLTLLNAADAALYSAKVQGRNCVSSA